MKKTLPGFFIGTVSCYFVIFALLCGGAAQAVEKIKPNNFDRWVVDGYEISMGMNCEISRSSFIPKKYCSQPAVVIERVRDSGRDRISFDTLYFKLVAGNIELGDKWIFDGNDDLQREGPLSYIRFGEVRSEELFKLLTSKADGLPIRFMTRSGQGAPVKSRVVVLSGFKSYAEEQIRVANYYYSQEEIKEKRKLIFTLILLAVFCGIIFMLIRYLIRGARGKIQAAKRHVDSRRVSRVAEDEAIREVVRNSVQRIDEQSLDALRNQIKAALDAGDTKAAEELLKIMNHLSKK